VDHARSGVHHLLHLLPKAREVRGEDGGRDTHFL